MNIRPANALDAPILASIMKSLTDYYLTNNRLTIVNSRQSDKMNSQLPKWLVDSMAEAAFFSRLHDNNFKHWVYAIENKVVGYIALKRDSLTGELSHLYHLFVLKAHHQQGVASALWAHAKTHTNAKQISVRSSLYAIPVYNNFGFEKVGDVQYKDGLAFQPMILVN